MSTLSTTPIITDKPAGTLVPVTGDVSADTLNVADDATIRGHATVKGNLRVEGWLDADNLRGACKGLFGSLDQLRTAYPHACDGAWAMVAETDNTATLYIGHFGVWEATQQGFPIQFDNQQFRESLNECIANLTAEVTARTTADSTKADKTYVDTQLDTKANQTYVNEQLSAKADQADFDKVAHLKNTPAIYRLWEAHNVDTVSINYNARKKADVDGSIIDAGGVTLPSATPYTNTPDGPTGGNAGVMTAQQATELETHKQRLDALTPVMLTQAQYDALVEAGTVGPNQHYAIVEDEQEDQA